MPICKNMRSTYKLGTRACALFDRAGASSHSRTLGSLMESRNSALLAQPPW